MAELEMQAANGGLDERAAMILDEQLTAMLTKIDAVDTLGRPNLRAVGGEQFTQPKYISLERRSNTGPCL